MAKRTRKNRLPPFVALPWEVLNSNAYKDLQPSAAKALPYFLGKPKLPYAHPEIYRVEFTFSYPEAKRFGFAYGTFSKVIRDLTAKGFISTTQAGGLRGNRKSYNKFVLSNEWKNYATDINKEKRVTLSERRKHQGLAIYRIASKL